MIRSTIARLRRGGMQRSLPAMWALAGLAGPTGLQLLYMIVAARVLGAEVTGQFLLIVSVAVVASSFVGLGGGGLVMRETARDPRSAAASFGRALAMSLVTFPILLPLVVVIAWLVTKGDVPVWVILIVAAADLLATRVLTTCWSLFIARDEQLRASLLICSMPLARLAAIALAILWPLGTRLDAFAALYCFVSFSVIAIALGYVRRRIGPSRLSLAGFNRRDGASFALTWLNGALQSEGDKLILSLFSSPSTVAVYAVAARLMDGAAMPPRALKTLFQSRLFREGASGHLGTYRLTLKILPITVLYGFVAWAGLWLLAPLVVWAFGPEFAALSMILPVLGALPLVRSVADFGAEVFLASDRPGIQAMTQSFATVLRVALGFALIAPFGLNGAVATALAVNIISGAILWTLAWKMSRDILSVTPGAGPELVPTRLPDRMRQRDA